MDFQTIESEALRLSVQARAKLAHDLLESLDSCENLEIENLWRSELARRMNAYEQGQLNVVASETVSKKARALLK